MPETLMVETSTLLLNGAGLRGKYVMGVDVYAAGLYLKNANHNPEAIISGNDTMAIRLHIVTTLVTPEKFTASTLEGFDYSGKNQGIDKAAIQIEMDKFVAIFKSGIEKNDIYDLVHIKGDGVRVFKNASTTPLVAIQNPLLTKALFGIWLTESPENHMKMVRKALLGL